MSKNTIIFVACPDQRAGNDSEALSLAFHQDPTFITSLAKEVMFLVTLVSLSVCLWTTLLKKL